MFGQISGGNTTWLRGLERGCVTYAHCASSCQECTSESELMLYLKEYHMRTTLTLQSTCVGMSEQDGTKVQSEESNILAFFKLSQDVQPISDESIAEPRMTPS